MAQSGDNYTSTVTFDVQGTGQAAVAIDTIKATAAASTAAAEAAKYYRDAQGRLRDEMGRFVGQAKQAELAAQGVAIATKQAGDAAEEAGGGAGGGAGGRGGKGFANLGASVMQFSQLMEDAQFGVRGIQNNISGLIMTVGGYTPYAMAAAGATSLLVGIFRDEIDGLLAWSGILDENLVKGMDRAKESTEGFAKAQSELLATFPGVTAQIKDQLAALEALSKKQDGTQAKRLAEQAILEETQYRVDDLRRSQEELAKAEANVESVKAMGAQANPAVIQNALFERDEARKRMEAIGVDRQQFAQDGFARQMAGAATSDQGMVKQAERLWDLGQKKGDKGLQDLASAIYKLTDQHKAETEALDASIKRQEEELKAIEKKEKENAALTFEEGGAGAGMVKKVEELFAERAKRESGRVGEVYSDIGPALREAAGSRLGAGEAPEDIGAALMGQMEAQGMEGPDAFAVVLEAIKEAMAERENQARENALQLQELFRTQAEQERQFMEEAMRAGWQARMTLGQQYRQMRAQNPGRNNRPNGW